MGYDDYGSVYGSMAGLFTLLLTIALIPAIIVYVLFCLGLMKVAQKAGVQGSWRAWIPFYNVMLFYKLGDVNPWLVFFWIALVIPYVNGLVGLFLTTIGLLAAYRITIKLKSEGGWVALAATVPPIWLLIMGFGQSRWNPNVPVAGWTSSGFLADNTQWEGIPTQASAAAAPGYGAPQGYAAPPQGYTAPPQGYTAPPQGYQAPAQPGYGAPAQPGYPAPAQPGYGAPVPPAPQAPGAPVPPPAVPPAPPTAPPAAPGTPPAPPADPTQPPA